MALFFTDMEKVPNTVNIFRERKVREFPIPINGGEVCIPMAVDVLYENHGLMGFHEIGIEYPFPRESAPDVLTPSRVDGC